MLALNHINKELKIEDLMKLEYNKENKIQIIIPEKNKIDEKKFILNNNLICPLCKENANIKISDYKIELFGCKNNHILKNIMLEEFLNMQKRYYFCEVCNSLINSHNFYKCLSCKTNICELCRINRHKNHNIINYNKKDIICELHNLNYNNYCNNCKKNFCHLCIESHRNHNISSFNDISSNINKEKNKLKELRIIIDLFNLNIQNIIEFLNKVMNNL